MSKHTVGDIVESRCSKCNDIMGHVILALVDGEIVKVQCKGCGGTHKYRPAKPEKAAKKASPRAKSAKSGGGRKKASSAVDRERWITEVNDQDTSRAKPYAMDGSFEVGDFVDNPKFGVGLVIRVMKPNRMEVLFEDGMKTLLCQA